MTQLTISLTLEKMPPRHAAVPLKSLTLLDSGRQTANTQRGIIVLRKLIFLFALFFLSILSLGAAHALPLPAEKLLIPPPDDVWIRGTTVELVDSKQCWSKNAEPILQVKSGRSFRTIAKGKLFNVGCMKKYPYEARYKFTLKHPSSLNNSQVVKFHSTSLGTKGATYTRRVYPSVRSFNEGIERGVDIFLDLLNNPNGQTPVPGSGSQSAPSRGWSGCYFNGRMMGGNVKVVRYGTSDFTVRRVDYAGDLRVKLVDYSYARRCGEWKMVEYGLSDFTIKMVDYGPADFTIKLVDYSPGR